jgi:hypothetical protein
MQVIAKAADHVELSFGDGQASLILQEQTQTLDHGSAYGRVAFACPATQVCC